MTLLLARHGETVWHAENRYAGSTDVPLTDLGRRQAAALGEWAVRNHVGSVHSSTLARAVVTATPAATSLETTLRQDPRLVEVAFGRGEGLTGAEMDADFPDEARAFRAAPGTIPLPGGESGESALERAWPALVDIDREAGDERALVVMHSTLLRLVLCRALGIDTNRYRSVFPSVGNVAITTLRFTSGQAALHGYNVPIF